MSSEWKGRAATGLAIAVLVGLYGAGRWDGFRQGKKAGLEEGYAAGCFDGAKVVCDQLNAYFGSNFIRIRPAEIPLPRPAPPLGAREARPAWPNRPGMSL